MVAIQMTNAFRFTDPMVLANPNRYYIELAEPGYKVPSISNQIYANDSSSGQQNGGPAQIKIYPDDQFLLTDEQFALLAQSAKQGGDTNFINILLYLVAVGTLEVLKDGAVQTRTQILNFTA